MIHIFVKPKTTNIWQATWNIVKTKWYFWAPLLLVFILGPLAIAIPSIYFIATLNKTRSFFWKEFADLNGWQYNDSIQSETFNLAYNNTNGESGVMFKEGNTRNISNEIRGFFEDRPFRIFCYQFSIGSDKNRRTFCYTVFAFKLNGSFPHIYLNNKSNSWSINTGEKIPLPVEFENKFSLSAPKEYEIEALEIFTPDILASLLNKGFLYDVEFVNQEILVFADGQINNFEQLETRFNKALELKDLMFEKLDKFKFEKIGDIPATLK
ncbi:MAG: hypothetical protein WCO07_02305 [bacterium]